MAGQINLAGTKASVSLFGNDVTETNLNFTFPSVSGELVSTAGATFTGNVQVAGDAISGAADGITLRDTGLINVSRGTGQNIFAGFKIIKHFFFIH